MEHDQILEISKHPDGLPDIHTLFDLRHYPADTDTNSAAYKQICSANHAKTAAGFGLIQNAFLDFNRIGSLGAAQEAVGNGKGKGKEKVSGVVGHSQSPE